MRGERRDLTDDYVAFENGGEYGKDAQGIWWMRPPQSDDFRSGMGNLSAHTVVEHEDGTITVSPSILVTGHYGKQWHGYLERGIWRQV